MTMLKPIMFWVLFTATLVGIIQLRDCDGKDRGEGAAECSRRGQPSGYNPSSGKWECGGK
jgi:hypothetical protein